MDNTRIGVLIGGVLMLVGVAMRLPSIMKLRGRAPWRGDAISAAALALYGLLALAGVVLNGTTLGALLIWGIAAAIWFGWWLKRRDTPRR